MKVADNPRRDYAHTEGDHHGVWTQLDHDRLHLMVVPAQEGIDAGTHPLASGPVALLDYAAAHDLYAVLATFLQQRPKPPKPRVANATDSPGMAAGFDK